MNGCCSLVKYLLILINFVFWTAGIVAFIIIGWALTNPSIASSLTQPKYESVSFIALCVFVVIATLTLIIAFLGCCGALKESQCMLVTFFGFLLVLLVAEVATGVYAYQYRDNLDKLVKAQVKDTVQNDYNVSETKTIIFDEFQTKFQCCGADGPLDWKTSKFNDNRGVNLDLSKPKTFFKVPRSCCRNTTTEALCAAFQIDVGASRVQSDTIYLKGCTEKLIAVVNDNSIYILAVFAGIIGVEILALLISLCLCCAVGNRDDHYKS